MWEVLVIMFIGIIVGYILRSKSKILKLFDKLCTYAIFILLFSLGIAVGKNDAVMNNLSELGLKSLAIAVAAMAGSIACGWLLHKFIFKKIKIE